MQIETELLQATVTAFERAGGIAFNNAPFKAFLTVDLAVVRAFILGVVNRASGKRQRDWTKMLKKFDRSKNPRKFILHWRASWLKHQAKPMLP
jgi:hypothetical protein